MQLKDIDFLLSKSMVAYLSKDEDNFARIAQSAIGFINNLTGYKFDLFTVINEDNNNTWLREPLAWFIEYFACRQLQGASERYFEECDINFKKAREICTANKFQKSNPGGRAKIGQIEGIYSDN